MDRRRRLTDAAEQQAAEMYRAGKATGDIAKALCASVDVIGHALRRQGVERRPSTSQRKFGREKTCPRCGEKHNTTQAYCMECARAYRRGYRKQRQEAAPPPPPPGFQDTDREVGRPWA